MEHLIRGSYLQISIIGCVELSVVLIFFFLLPIVLAKNSNTMINNSGDLVLFLTLGKGFSFVLFSVRLAIGLHI
jgi:hypothetical protein